MAELRPDRGAGGAGRPALAAAGTTPAVLDAATLALVAGLAAAWRTRNVFWTIAAGMGVYWVLRLVGVA
jgi:branched-subunit amino acid transport protein